MKPARPGYRLIPCDGAAHSNPHIDNCSLCAPRWGWREVPVRVAIKVPAGFVYGFSSEHQIVQVTDDPSSARLFMLASARAFIRKYSGAGYAFERATAQIVPHADGIV